MAAPEVFATVSPNPFVDNSSIMYRLDAPAAVNISLFNSDGRELKVLVNKNLKAGTYTEKWSGNNLNKGAYFIRVTKDGEVKQTIKVVKG
jgi:hypothetical protein